MKKGHIHTEESYQRCERSYDITLRMQDESQVEDPLHIELWLFWEAPEVSASSLGPLLSHRSIPFPLLLIPPLRFFLLPLFFNSHFNLFFFSRMTEFSHQLLFPWLSPLPATKPSTVPKPPSISNRRKHRVTV